MKAPDKIYITTLSANKVYGNNWGCWTDRECPGETYIRKDALLEHGVEREVKEDAGGYPYIDATELYDYTEDKPLARKGDKVLVIVIREGEV